jgi:hypothetical protein
VLPGRLGVRFALETLFIVLLAVGAGLADLRPAFIVLVMAAAWLLVALIELAAERIARSPVSYLLPAEPAAEPDEEVGREAEAERVFGPPVEERTVVAPPQALEEEEPSAGAEPEPEPTPGPEPRAEPPALPAEAEVDSEADSMELRPRRRLGSLLRRPEPQSEPEPEALPEPDEEAARTEEPEPELEPAAGGRLRSLFRRREEEPEPIPEPPPRHVKLLPRRPAPEPAPAAREVAEVFDEDGADAEETAG